MKCPSASMLVALLFSAGLGCSSSGGGAKVSSPGTGGDATGTGGDGAGGSADPTGSGGYTGAGATGQAGGTGQGGFTGTGATVNGFLIPNDHPRLFWTPDRIARAKAWYAANGYTPSKGTDQDAIADQLFMYMVTGTASYCQQAISNASQIDLSSCTPDKNGCDNARYYGEVLAATYDWCFAQLSSSQKSTFVSNLNTWFTNISQQSWGGVPMSESNYYFGNLRNEAEWGIASYFENQTTATALLNDALVTRYANDFVPASNKVTYGLGGLALEGEEYGRYQGFYIGALIFPAISAAGRDIFDETSYWKGAVFNRIYRTPPQRTMGTLRPGWDAFPFDDDETWQNGSPADQAENGTFMTAAANQWNAENVGRWARQWISNVGADVNPAAAATDVGGSLKDFSSLPLDYYDGGPRYLIGRNNWTTNATTYMFQMGEHYSDGHVHQDWGQFQINRQGRWLTRETVGYSNMVPAYGGGSNSVDTNTGVPHNIMLVNGTACDGTGDRSAKVNRLESQAGYVYADDDLTPLWSSGMVSHVEREYWFIRDIETFVIFDRLVSTSASQSKTFLIHCETNPTLIDATHIHCVNGSQQLAITTLLPTTPSSRTVVNEGTSSNNPPPSQNVTYRVEINDKPNAATSYTLHVLQAMDASGTPLSPTVTDSASGTPTSGTFTVKLDGSHSLVINKGTTSSGGSITIGGTTTNLRADVEPFALGSDDTPIWGP